MYFGAYWRFKRFGTLVPWVNTTFKGFSKINLTKKKWNFHEVGLSFFLTVIFQNTAFNLPAHLHRLLQTNWTTQTSLCLEKQSSSSPIQVLGFPVVLYLLYIYKAKFCFSVRAFLEIFTQPRFDEIFFFHGNMSLSLIHI